MNIPTRPYGAPPIGGGGFNPFAAGAKAYGMGMRPNPNQGQVGSLQAAAGYGGRDAAAAARRAALIQRAALK